MKLYTFPVLNMSYTETRSSLVDEEDDDVSDIGPMKPMIRQNRHHQGVYVSQRDADPNSKFSQFGGAKDDHSSAKTHGTKGMHARSDIGPFHEPPSLVQKKDKTR